MLTENIAVLSGKYVEVWNGLCKVGKCSDEKVRVENSRSDMPTLWVEYNGRKVYIHSKYNPVNEAEVFVKQFGAVDRYAHVIFYGVGLAYHIEAFFSKFGNKHFTIYEPFLSIINSYISARSMKNLPLDYLDNIYIGELMEDPYECIDALLESIEGDALLVMLPGYESAFSDEYKSFYRRFGSVTEDRKTMMRTNRLFEKLLVTNIMKNFRDTIESPNILHLKNNPFRGKPAILAAAGPSLEYELDNLRDIKEKGLAYIFSVGSAINTLLEYGVYPDAALTFDPQGHNPVVFRKLYEKGVTGIPIVFGTSVGYGTVQPYKGTRFHFINRDDSIARYFFRLDSGEEIDDVPYSGSIAVAALQILYKLGCHPIILAGQNLAYRERRFYAKGIDHGMGSSEMDAKYLEESFLVNDTEGNKIYTDKVLNHYREELERYIEQYGIKNVINTTKGGAAIAGTVYKPLREVMEDVLKESITADDWFMDKGIPYDISYMINRFKAVKAQCNELKGIFDRMKELTVQINNTSKPVENPELLFSCFCNEFGRMVENAFFSIFVYPMNYYQCSLLNEKISNLNQERDKVRKIHKLCTQMEMFIDGCIKDMRLIMPLFEDMYEAAVTDNDIKVLTFTIRA